jgi:pyruvate formate lyase activating enzyme
MLDKCKAKGYHSAVDTTGYAPKDLIMRVGEKTSLMLYDLKLINSSEHEKYTGVRNEQIMQNLKALCDAGQGEKIWIRFPVIPGITDTKKNVSELKDYLKTLFGIKQINLLPYHRMGERKYKILGLDYKLEGVKSPSAEEMQELKKEFEELELKLNVKIGG